MKENNKEYYKKFCENNTNVSIFSQPWWLDILCEPQNWSVSIVKDNGVIVATLPFYFTSSSKIKMPLLTMFMGPSFWNIDTSNSYKKKSAERKYLNELIGSLSGFNFFTQRFAYEIEDWLPFYWNGFTQTTKYSYQLSNLNDINGLSSAFHRSKIKNINKAMKMGLRVLNDLSAEEFFENHKLTLAKQNRKISYNKNTFIKLYNAVYKRNQGKVIYCEDNDGVIHSALFIVWDANRAYNLISTIDPDYRVSGSAALLIKTAIAYVSDFVDVFDFSGSMDENIESSIRKFGGKQKGYLQVTRVSKNKSIILSYLDRVLKLIE